MPAPDVFVLRNTLMEQQILLCFNGPFTAGLIEEIGRALRNHMQDLEESPSSVTDVFSVYIEMTQNIRNYMVKSQIKDSNAISSIVVSLTEDGHYAVSAGNIVHDADGVVLSKRVAELAAMDKAQLKTLFKTQLRQPRESLQGSAGLGLIDMARKATHPLSCDLRPAAEGFSFFSLRVVL